MFNMTGETADNAGWVLKLEFDQLPAINVSGKN